MPRLLMSQDCTRIVTKDARKYLENVNVTLHDLHRCDVPVLFPQRSQNAARTRCAAEAPYRNCALHVRKGEGLRLVINTCRVGPRALALIRARNLGMCRLWRNWILAWLIRFLATFAKIRIRSRFVDWYSHLTGWKMLTTGASYARSPWCTLQTPARQ
ncbi:hypothetical protein BC830DRAFT_1117186 [Chytriomyces sp. MP71]|nr:hypothetical protein BC830DRAFT_1117186 [Chytriomyces sp. MP71]